MGLSCGVVCVIQCLAVLIQYRCVTDTQTDTRRRHIPRLAQPRAVKTREKQALELRRVLRFYLSIGLCIDIACATIQNTALT